MKTPTMHDFAPLRVSAALDTFTYPDAPTDSLVGCSPVITPAADGRPRVAVLGATGSIGTQAFEVMEHSGGPEVWNVVGIAAGGSKPELLIDYITRWNIPVAAIADPQVAAQVRAATGVELVTDPNEPAPGSATTAASSSTAGIAGTAAHATSPCVHGSGSPGAHAGAARCTADIASSGAVGARTTGRRLPELLVKQLAGEVDIVLNALVGATGVGATIATLRAGARLALANKESLIAGGAYVTDAAARGQLIPVDSEHSAIAQCLRSGTAREVDRLVITASGGPFRGMSRSELAAVTPDQAGVHPTWSMGPMNTLNSASLVNKGLELMEASLMFGVPEQRIDVTVHPQSIVHSMVTFCDGATIAQASPPSMTLPIALALGWPARVPRVHPALSWESASDWHFEPVDNEAFPAVELARHALRRGGALPAVYNASNEVAVSAFMDGRLLFPQITEVIEAAMQRLEDLAGEQITEDTVWDVDAAARAAAAECVQELG